MFYQNKRGALALAFALSITSLLTACGSASSASKSADSIGNSATDPGNGTSVVYNPSPTPSPSASPTATGLPAVTDSFSMSGNAGTHTTPAQVTDNLFVVKVTAGPAGLNTGSAYTQSYNCITVRVTLQFQNTSGTWVNGQSVTTSPLSVSGSCGQHVQAAAATSQTIDFSSQLTAGHGQVRVVVDQSRYDVYCTWFWAGQISPYYYTSSQDSLYCSASLYPVASMHTVTGSLELQVNGTVL